MPSRFASVVLGCVGLACIGASRPPNVVHDVSYAKDGLRAHQLDLYLPQHAQGPLIVFVHGGAFIDGDRRWYENIGRDLAAQGYQTAIVSYRLYPDANALGATQDVAAAIAWLEQRAPQAVIASKIFLTGHSAGGQIVSLLATNTKLLTDQGASIGNLCGALSDAGIYDVRDISGEEDWMEKADEKIYGATAQQRALVSPQVYVGPSSLPMLAACGTNDDPDACGRAMRFVRALKAAGGSAAVVREEGADHMRMLAALHDTTDPLNKIMREFIAAHC